MLPVEPALKDFAINLNQIYYSIVNGPLSHFSSYLIVQSTLFFILSCIKDSFVYIFTFQWLPTLSYLPNLIPEIQHSVLNESYIIKEPFSTLFTFLEVPTLGHSKIFLGFFNSFFLMLPLSVGHLLTVRRLLLYGILPGFVSVGGTIIGQLCFVSSVLFGLRFIVIPWFSNPFIHFSLVFFVIYSIVLDETVSQKAFNLKRQKQKSTLTSFFIDNFILAWAEQVSLFQFFQNLTFGAQPTPLESFSYNDGLSFVVQTLGYIEGLAFGSFFFACLFGWGLICFRDWIYSVSTYSFVTVFKTLNYLSALTINVFLFSSNPLIFYGFDYLTLNQLGFLPQSFVNSPNSQYPLSIDESTYFRRPRIAPWERIYTRKQFLNTRNKNISSFDAFPAPALISKSTPRYYPFDQRFDAEFKRVANTYPHEFDCPRSTLLERSVRQELDAADKKAKQELTKPQLTRFERYMKEYTDSQNLLKFGRKLRMIDNPTSNKFWLKHDLLYDLPRLKDLKPKKTDKDFNGLTKKLKSLITRNASSLNASRVNKFFSTRYNYTNRQRAFSLSHSLHLEEQEANCIDPFIEGLYHHKAKPIFMVITVMDSFKKFFSHSLVPRRDIVSSIYKRLKSIESKEQPQPPLDRLATKVFFYKRADYSFGDYRTNVAGVRALREKLFLYELKKSPLWKLIRRVKFDSNYLNQPTFQRLKSGEEHRLFIKRQILGSFYDGFRYHNQMPDLEQFQLENKNLKSESLKVFNHQFKGHKFFTKQRFETTFKPRQFLTFLKATTTKPRDLNPVFKYDQPLFLDKKLTGYKKYSAFHEELPHSSQHSRRISYKDKKQPSPKRFLEISNSTPFFAGVEPNSGKLVISNQLYPRLNAGYLLGHQRNGRFTTFIKSKIKPNDEMKKSPQSFSSWSIMNQDSSDFCQRVSNIKEMTSPLPLFHSPLPLFHEELPHSSQHSRRISYKDKKQPSPKRFNEKMKKSHKSIGFTLWPLNQALINRKTKSNLLSRVNIRDENVFLSKPKQSSLTYSNQRKKYQPLFFPDFDKKAAPLPAKPHFFSTNFIYPLTLKPPFFPTNFIYPFSAKAQSHKEKKKEQKKLAQNNLFNTMEMEKEEIETVREERPLLVTEGAIVLTKKGFSTDLIGFKKVGKKFTLLKGLSLMGKPKQSSYKPEPLDRWFSKMTSTLISEEDKREDENIRWSVNKKVQEKRNYAKETIIKGPERISSGSKEGRRILIKKKADIQKENAENPIKAREQKVFEAEQQRILTSLGLGERGLRKEIKNFELMCALESKLLSVANPNPASEDEEIDRILTEPRVRNLLAILLKFNTNQRPSVLKDLRLYNKTVQTNRQSLIVQEMIIKESAEFKNLELLNAVRFQLLRLINPYSPAAIEAAKKKRRDLIQETAQINFIYGALREFNPNLNPLQSYLLYKKINLRKEQSPRRFRLFVNSDDFKMLEVNCKIRKEVVEMIKSRLFPELLGLSNEESLNRLTDDDRAVFDLLASSASLRALNSILRTANPNIDPLQTLVQTLEINRRTEQTSQKLKEIVGERNSLDIISTSFAAMEKILIGASRKADYSAYQAAKKKKTDLIQERAQINFLYGGLREFNPNVNPLQSYLLCKEINLRKKQSARRFRLFVNSDNFKMLEVNCKIRKEVVEMIKSRLFPKFLGLSNEEFLNRLTDDDRPVFDLLASSISLQVLNSILRTANPNIDPLQTLVQTLEVNRRTEQTSQKLKEIVGERNSLDIISTSFGAIEKIIRNASTKYDYSAYQKELSASQKELENLSQRSAELTVIHEMLAKFNPNVHPLQSVIFYNTAVVTERLEELKKIKILKRLGELIEKQKRKGTKRIKKLVEKEKFKAFCLRYKLNKRAVNNLALNNELYSGFLKAIGPVVDRITFTGAVDKKELKSRFAVAAQLRVINAAIERLDPTYGTPQHSTMLNTVQTYIVYSKALSAEKRIKEVEKKRRLKKRAEVIKNVLRKDLFLGIRFHFNLVNNKRLHAIEEGVEVKVKTNKFTLPPQSPSISYKVLKKEKKEALPQLPTTGPASYFNTFFREPLAQKDKVFYGHYEPSFLHSYIGNRRVHRKKRKKARNRKKTQNLWYNYNGLMSKEDLSGIPDLKGDESIARGGYDIQKKSWTSKVSKALPPFLSLRLYLFPLFNEFKPENNTGTPQDSSSLKESKTKTKTQKRKTKKHKAVTDVTSKATIKKKQRGKKPKTKQKSEMKQIKKPMKKRIQLRVKKLKKRLQIINKLIKKVNKGRRNKYRVKKDRKPKPGKRIERVRDFQLMFSTRQKNSHLYNFQNLGHIRRLKLIKLENSSRFEIIKRRFKQGVYNSVLPSNKNTRNWPGFLPVRYELLTKDQTAHDAQRGILYQEWVRCWPYYCWKHYVDPNDPDTVRYLAIY